MIGLVFDIKGKFANFKKYYSNSSSLSYYYPPRTVIIGIIAAILGKEKESYYEEFSYENLAVGLSVKNKLKKSFHKLNYLKIENPNDLNGSQEFHTQIPFEVVTAANYNENIFYRIYLSQKKVHSNENIIEDLKTKLNSKEQIFPVYLGKSGFKAEIYYDGKEYNFVEDTSDELINFDSIINKDKIIEIDFSDGYFMLVEDLIPIDFINNYDRVLKIRSSFIFSNGKRLRARIKYNFYSCMINGEIEYFDFME